MAEEVQIRGTQATAKIRNPLGVIGLMLLTLGIYGVFYYYFINKEMAELGKATGRTQELRDSPGTSVLALFIAPVAYNLLQDSLNKGWQAQAGGFGQVGSGGAPGLPQQQQQGSYQPGQYTQQ